MPGSARQARHMSSRPCSSLHRTGRVRPSEPTPRVLSTRHRAATPVVDRWSARRRCTRRIPRRQRAQVQAARTARSGSLHVTVLASCRKLSSKTSDRRPIARPAVDGTGFRASSACRADRGRLRPIGIGPLVSSTRDHRCGPGREQRVSYSSRERLRASVRPGVLDTPLAVGVGVPVAVDAPARYVEPLTGVDHQVHGSPTVSGPHLHNSCR